MLFFSNPKRGKGRARNRRRAVARRRGKRRSARVRSTGGSMARKSRKRRASTGRRRRRRSGAKAPSVALRRRGVTVYRSNPRRRRRSYRSNPGGSGIVSTLKQGVKDGAVVLVSQIAARKAINVASAFNPIKGVAGSAITGLGVPVILTIAARKIAPAQARLVSAAAFAEGMRGILASTPVGPFLAGFSAGTGYLDGVDDVDGSLEAWPSVPQIGAYPTLGDEAEYVQ